MNTIAAAPVPSPIPTLTQIEHRRRTKIVATLGPASDEPSILDALVAAGMDAARLNCSHADAADLRRRSQMVREVAVRASRPIALLFDLQGPKIRLAADTPQLELRVGDQVRFTGPDGGGDPPAVVPAGDLPEAPLPPELRVAYAGFTALLTDRSQIVIGDGTPRFVVLRRGAQEILATASSPGLLGPRKGVNVTHAQPTLPALTPKDLADVEVAAECEADFVALSFVRTADDVHALRERLSELRSDARIIAKIEKVEAFENLESILEAADGVMVARGDYGVEAGLSRVPLMQKNTIHRATQSGKVVITATQMLESMITTPEPTRAEVTDVANAVIDGTSAVMLSAETGIGRYPVEAVRTMAEVAGEAEGAMEIYAAQRRRASEESPDAAVMYAAVSLGREVDAAALVIPTSGGGTPRACAKYRPRRPIVALSHNPRVVNQLALEWGVYPRIMHMTSSTDELVEHALEAAKAIAGLPSGALVVITAGPSTGRAGATNLIMLREVP